MPAATATPRPDHASPAGSPPGGTALQSGVSLTSPPSAPLPLRSSAPSPSSSPRSSDSSASSAFSSHADAILSALADPECSLNSVARQFNLSLAALTLWLARPEIQARVREMETGASTHTRLASSLNLSSAVRVLVRILDDFHALARSKPDPATHLSDLDYIRASERARKAAYHLYRLSRIVPIDAAHLALARVHSVRVPLVPGQHSEPEPVLDESRSPSRTTNTRERTSSTPGSQLPNQPVHPAGALHDLPTASSLKDDADSRVETSSSPPAPLPLRPSDPSPSPPRSSDPSASSAALRVENAFSSPSSLDDLNAHLEQLAASRGIDLSDVDADAPLPPEFMALFPPEVAAFLEVPPEPTESPPAPCTS
ncbi:MAG: hypothetical protein KF838_08975 [Phycisphaeraceae bacterium]|nr:MAG: hypothetical protein KF838_08975 [Phycisphaeraceae bacterium]